MAGFRIEDYSHPDDPRLRRKFIFECPRRPGHECMVLLKPWPIQGAPTWEMTGPNDAPTLSPSINCGECGWHGFVQKGKFINA